MSTFSTGGNETGGLKLKGRLVHTVGQANQVYAKRKKDLSSSGLCRLRLQYKQAAQHRLFFFGDIDDLIKDTAHAKEVITEPLSDSLHPWFLRMGLATYPRQLGTLYSPPANSSAQ